MIEFKEANNFLFKLQKNKNKIQVCLRENTVFIQIKNCKETNYLVWRQTPKGFKKELVFPSITNSSDKWFHVVLFNTVTKTKKNNNSLITMDIPDKKTMKYKEVKNWYSLFIKSLKEDFQSLNIEDLSCFGIFEVKKIYNLLERCGFEKHENYYKKYLIKDLHIRANLSFIENGLLHSVLGIMTLSYQNDKGEQFRGRKEIKNFNLEEVEKEIILFLNEDYKCPRCGNYMIKRRNGKTRKLFWGCVNYPECEMTLPYKYWAIPNKESCKKYLVENG